MYMNINKISLVLLSMNELLTWLCSITTFIILQFNVVIGNGAMFTHQKELPSALDGIA